MAKMIKHKDSYINQSVYNDMLKKIQRIEVCTETATKVHMNNKHGLPIDAKILFPIDEVAQNIEAGEYSGEISEFLFSYYIGEV